MIIHLAASSRKLNRSTKIRRKCDKGDHVGFTKKKADRLLVVRVRERTERRFRRAKRLARAIGDAATGDAVIAAALDLYARRTRHRLGQAGIPLPPEGGQTPEPNPEAFTGVPTRTPFVDE